jgi:CRP/FNR family transcriptional regulator
METIALSPLAARVAEVFPTLALASRATLERIARDGIHSNLHAGTLIYSPHSPCGGFPLVLAGCIRVLQRYPNGREIQLYRVKAGESCLLAGAYLLGQTNCNACGIAETEIEVLILPPQTFHALVAEDETFRRHVFLQYGERLSALVQIVDANMIQKMD